MTRYLMAIIALATTAHMACWAEPKPWEVCGEGGFIAAEHVSENARSSATYKTASLQLPDEALRALTVTEAVALCRSAVRLSSRLAASCGYAEFDRVWVAPSMLGHCTALPDGSAGPKAAEAIKAWVDDLNASLKAMKAARDS